MLDLDVVPERAIGNEQWEFTLGMPLNQAIHIIRSQDRVIKQAQLCHSDQVPLSCDVVINLVQDGINLTFDPELHRLKKIEVYNFNKLKLKYGGMCFSHPPTILPDFSNISGTFGATHPGVYHKDKRQFTLHFRGVSFIFAIDAKLEPQYEHGLGKISFDTPPPVSKMIIYSGNTLDDVRPPTFPLCCYHGNAYLERLEVRRDGSITRGIRVAIVMDEADPRQPSDTKKRILERSINFGDSVEDVVLQLGAPSRKFYKIEDKMRIHSASAHKLKSQTSSDYFYNYFTLGLDILFDGSSHRVRKFVLHTNYPCHYNFNMYYRCFFEIPFTVSKDRSAAALSGLEQSEQEQKIIEFDTKWTSIAEWARTQGPPVVLSRCSSTNSTNPFPSPLCHCVEDCVFEVMPNNHIASVTLFHTPVARDHTCVA